MTSQILGGIALLIACTSLGLARVIELLQQAATERAAAEKHALTLSEFIADARYHFLIKSRRE